MNNFSCILHMLRKIITNQKNREPIIKRVKQDLLAARSQNFIFSIMRLLGRALGGPQPAVFEKNDCEKISKLKNLVEMQF